MQCKWLTVWSRAIDLILTIEKALTKGDGFKDHAPLSHRILLLRDILNPFPLADIRACPKCHLIVLPTKMNKSNGKAFALDFNRGIKDVWCALTKRVPLVHFLAATLLSIAITVISVIIIGKYEQKLQWYGLCYLPVSQSIWTKERNKFWDAPAGRLCIDHACSSA